MDGYDYAGQSAALARRKQLLEALQRRSQHQPYSGQSTSNNGVAVSMASGTPIAGIIRALQERKLSKDLASGTAELENQIQQGYVEGLDAYQKTHQGQSYNSGVLKPNADGSAQQINTADPRKAIFDAMSSNNPALRAFGQQEFERFNKTQDTMNINAHEAAVDGKVTERDLLGHATSDSIIGSGGNPAGFKPKPNLTSYGPGETIVNEDGNLHRIGGMTEDDVTTSTSPTGDFNVVTQTGPRQVNAAPSPGTVVNVNGNNRFMDKLGELNATRVMSVIEDKQSAVSILDMMGELRTLTSEGTFSGPLANVATFMNNLGNSFGIPLDTEELARSEEYRARINEQVSEAILNSSVGRGFTDKDAETFRASFPDLVNSPEGRMEIINNIESKALQEIKHAEEFEAWLTETNPGAAQMFGIGMRTVPNPREVTQEPMDIAEYLESLGQ